LTIVQYITNKIFPLEGKQWVRIITGWER